MNQTDPINDGIDGWQALCVDGTTLDRVHCSGIVMINGQVIRCSDPSHADLMSEAT